MTIHEIAEWLGGEVIGDNVENAPAIERVAKIEEADSGSLTFLANPKYEKHLGTYSCNCCACFPKARP